MKGYARRNPLGVQSIQTCVKRTCRGARKMCTRPVCVCVCACAGCHAAVPGPGHIPGRTKHHHIHGHTACTCVTHTGKTHTHTHTNLRTPARSLLTLHAHILWSHACKAWKRQLRQDCVCVCARALDALTRAPNPVKATLMRMHGSRAKKHVFGRVCVCVCVCAGRGYPCTKPCKYHPHTAYHTVRVPQCTTPTPSPTFES